MSDVAASPFGRQLKSWRRVRRMSQLDLGLMAEVSPRHVCFVENGRARPSRAVVMRLAESLELPLRDRNALLLAAGFAPAYSEGELSDAALAPVQRAIGYVLDNHEPFPAFVIDRLWNVVMANRAASMMFPGVSEPGKTVNAMRMLFEPGPLRAMVENWDELARATLLRLRREAARAGADPELNELIEEAAAHVEGGSQLEESEFSYGPMMPTRIRMGERVLATISTVASFGTALDVTVNELRIELVFPADQETEGFFRDLAV
jgi:transcriptional regulator with XRE-family HTH domain